MCFFCNLQTPKVKLKQQAHWHKAKCKEEVVEGGVGAVGVESEGGVAVGGWMSMDVDMDVGLDDWMRLELDIWHKLTDNEC